MTELHKAYRLDGIGPLYRQIKRAIAGPILSGNLAPGTRLPSELTLTKVFETSRMTVNRALQMLADDGLIIRRRRSGTFVASQVTEHTVMELRDIADEIGQTGTYRYQCRVRERRPVDPLVAERLGVPASTKTIFLSCCHYCDDTPFVIEERHIILTTVPDAADQTFAVEPPGHWLLKNVPWTRAEHAIAAINADAATARLLRIPENTACLQIERTTWLADRPVTLVILTYPGNTHRLIGGFTPGR